MIVAVTEILPDCDTLLLLDTVDKAVTIVGVTEPVTLGPAEMMVGDTEPEKDD